MSSPLPPPKKKSKPRGAVTARQRTSGDSRTAVHFPLGHAPSAASARSAQGTRPPSGAELAGSSTLNPLAPEEQPEARQPATKQPVKKIPPQSFRSARRAKIREKVQKPGGRLSVQPAVQDQAGGADSGELELAVMRPPSEGHSRPVVEPEKMHFWQLPICQLA